MQLDDPFDQPFATLADLIGRHAQTRPGHLAVVAQDKSLTYGALDALMDRTAAALQRDGVGSGDTVAICATASIAYVAGFLGALRAGAVVAPLAPSSTPESLTDMLADCAAKLLFLDKPVGQALATRCGIAAVKVALDDEGDELSYHAWLGPPGARPAPVEVAPQQAFNIIYSSGTTGAPKGIVQSHAMRWNHICRGPYQADAVTMVSTPLYSNTTLVSLLPTLARAATVVLMPKFDAGLFLEESERRRATHAMLVPVQYRRLMQRADFDTYDLSSYRLKLSTSAPFSAELKADVLKRWPGGLLEYYGMTEGGGTCILLAHEHPDKLHTVGQPAPEHDIRLIDEDGVEVSTGAFGEVVGRSPAMMAGYHNQPAKTRDAEWASPQGLRYIRTGDVGHFDAEGFLTLVDRKKDMIISGGFNVYPSDLEAEIDRHPAVLESAVVGVASAQWGETPVAFVALRSGGEVSAPVLQAWVNARLGKTQRLSDLRLVDALPRSAIGKVLKRELRSGYQPEAA